MKIAVYYNVPKGGAKRAIYHMVKGLAERGHTLLEVVPSTAETQWSSIEKYIIKQKVWPFTWPVWQRRIPLLTPYLQLGASILGIYQYHRLAKRMAEWLEFENIDVLFANDCTFLLNPPIVCYSKAPSFLYIHHGSHLSCYATQNNSLVEEGRPSFLENIKDHYYSPVPYIWDNIRFRNEKLSARRATKIGCNSTLARELIYKAYGKDSQVIHLGVDISAFSKSEQSKVKNYVMTAGAITPHKSFGFLIQSLGLLPEVMRPELIIASPHNESEELNNINMLATKWNVKIKIIKPESDEELVRLYSEAQAFLFAAPYEAFGLVVLEAMACGTPVIGVDDGGYRDCIIDGYTGYITRRDTKEYAIALAKIVQDPALQTQMGKQAKEHVIKNWTWKNTTSELETNLMAVIQTGQFPDLLK